MAKLIFLGRSFYLRMTLTYRISTPVGFSVSKMHTVTGPGIASILAVIHESNHAHFLTSFRTDKVNALWHMVNTLLHQKKTAVNMQFGGAARRKDCFLHSLMPKTRHVALSARSWCAPQAAQGLAGAIFRVTSPTSPRPTLSADAEPIFRGKFPRKWHHQQFSWRQLASIPVKGLKPESLKHTRSMLDGMYITAGAIV